MHGTFFIPEGGDRDADIEERRTLWVADVSCGDDEGRGAGGVKDGLLPLLLLLLLRLMVEGGSRDGVNGYCCNPAPERLSSGAPTRAGVCRWWWL